MNITKNNYDIYHFNKSPVVGPEAGKKFMRREHLSYALNAASTNGVALEFGVRTGKTFNQICEHRLNEMNHGFDSFEGLPEDWEMSPGAVALAGRQQDNVPIPVCPKNGKFWVGWFDTTIDEYIKENKEVAISFIHVDCDIYSSTKTIFDKLNNLIKPGCVIVFDEFHPWGNKKYNTWQEHEYKALKEWVNTYDREFQVLAHTNHWQCSIKITK